MSESPKHSPSRKSPYPRNAPPRSPFARNLQLRGSFLHRMGDFSNISRRSSTRLAHIYQPPPSQVPLRRLKGKQSERTSAHPDTLSISTKRSVRTPGLPLSPTGATSLLRYSLQGQLQLVCRTEELNRRRRVPARWTEQGPSRANGHLP